MKWLSGSMTPLLLFYFILFFFLCVSENKILLAHTEILGLSKHWDLGLLFKIKIIIKKE